MKLILGILLFIYNLSFAQELKIVTPESYLKENPSLEREAVVDLIIKQFEGRSVSQAELDDLWNNQETREALNLARFQVINQKLYAEGTGHEEIGAYFRAYIQFFQRLVQKYKIPDVDFIIHTADQLQVESKDENKFLKKLNKIPSFMFAIDLKDEYESERLLILDPLMLMSKHRKVLSQIKETNKQTSWESKIDKLYWRGSSTGSASLQYKLENISKLPRLVLTFMSKLYPDKIDAKFTYLREDAFAEDEKGRLEKIIDILGMSESDKVKEIDHLKYKYLASIDGNTATGTRIPWIMLSNSVLVKQDSNKIEWFYPAMKPYVHYVPIKEDLTDIFAQIEWMRANDEQVKQISENAQNFVSNSLMPQDLEAHMVIILNEYSKIQQDKKIVAKVRSAEETRSFISISIGVIKRIKKNFVEWINSLWQ